MNRKVKLTLGAMGALLLLGADSLVTWALSTRFAKIEVGAPAYSEAVEDPMARFRLEREQLRARQEAQLNDIIHSDRSDGETISLAQAQLLQLISGSRAEQTLEGILQSRGFEDALVSVGEGSANVLIRGNALNQRESAVIMELVMRETGLTGGNVKIIPVK